MTPAYTKHFLSWLKKRPKKLQPLIREFPPGKYRVLNGAPYAISAPGTVVDLMSYGNMQVPVTVMREFKDENGIPYQKPVHEQKWVQCLSVVVKSESKLPEAIERENVMARENVQAEIMREIFAKAQDDIAKRLMSEIPDDYMAAEQKAIEDAKDDEQALKAANDAFTKKELEKAAEIENLTKKELEKPDVKKPLLSEAAKRLDAEDTKKKIQEMAEKFHKENVMVNVEPKYLEVIEISPKILIS